VTDTHVDDIHAESQHTHPPDSEYVFVALFLAIVTGAEVALYYIDLGFLTNAILLSIMMIVKFATVVMFFMHLRFDSKIFRYFFITGLVFATVCYLVVLTTFHFWTGG
jgi:cytochrome c oxidase subunit 4